MSVGFLLVRGGFDLPAVSAGASQLAVASGRHRRSRRRRRRPCRDRPHRPRRSPRPSSPSASASLHAADGPPPPTTPPRDADAAGPDRDARPVERPLRAPRAVPGRRRLLGLHGPARRQSAEHRQLLRGAVRHRARHEPADRRPDEHPRRRRDPHAAADPLTWRRSTTTPVEVLTFDCYGTLIDWEAGIAAGARGGDAGTRPRRAGRGAARDVRRARGGRWRRARTSATARSSPGRAARVCADLGIAPTDDEARGVRRSVGEWPAFPDSAGGARGARPALPARGHHELRRRPVRGVEPPARRDVRLDRHRPAGRQLQAEPPQLRAGVRADRPAPGPDPPRRPEPVPRPRAGAGARAAVGLDQSPRGSPGLRRDAAGDRDRRTRRSRTWPRSPRTRSRPEPRGTPAAPATRARRVRSLASILTDDPQRAGSHQLTPRADRAIRGRARPHASDRPADPGPGGLSATSWRRSRRRRREWIVAKLRPGGLAARFARPRPCAISPLTAPRGALVCPEVV